MIKKLGAVCAVALAMSGCVAEKEEGVKLTDALDGSAWSASQWISVVDAPVVEGMVQDGTRAADGANWFVSTLKNEKKVVSAKWMTTGLGVYDIYINGKLINSNVKTKLTNG
ncbi:MAG: hypothetical protein ACI4UL_10255, partial [Muribaculaceae bacterium]